MIERIIIENFKSIRKLDLELKPINILIGANGAGKSNFVSFFKLSNRIYEGKLIEFIGSGFNRLLYFGRKKSERIYGLLDFDKIAFLDFEINPSPNNDSGFLASLNLRQNNKKHQFYQDWDIVWNYSWIQFNQQILYNRNADNGRNVIQNILLSYQKYRHLRKASEIIETHWKSLKMYHFHDTGKDSPMKLMNELNDNRSLRENGENLTSYLYYLKEKHPKDFQKIENQIRSVASFFDRFDLEPDRLNENQIELRWLEKGSDAYFNAYDLSDGTLRFMALTTLLMQPDLPKTIIIDEPELGLHPFAINKLAAMIKQAAAKGSQVIVSTQSVGLIDNFEPEDIITVDREDDQSVFKRLNSEDLKDWLEDYTLGELWNKNVIGARP